MVSKKTGFVIVFGVALLVVGIVHFNTTITGMVVAKETDSILIDVRTLPEYLESRIPDSILIPYDEIQSKIGNVANKDSEIIVYCRSGRRSSIAKNTLESLGYTNVKNLGGIIDWNGPTISGP